MEFTLFSRKICFTAIYAVLSRNLFCRCLRTFCVETTYGQNVVRGEKMTNIMYAIVFGKVVTFVKHWSANIAIDISIASLIIDKISNHPVLTNAIATLLALCGLLILSLSGNFFNKKYVHIIVLISHVLLVFFNIVKANYTKVKNNFMKFWVVVPETINDYN